MKNIVLVFGGSSVEHDISILTALTFSKNYLGNNRLCSLYISKSGEWFFCAKRLNQEMFKGELSSDFMPVKLFTNDKNLYTKTLLGYKKVFEVDVAINCCHGGAGEKGELNYLFESSGIAISSGSSLGLAIAMDKSVSKKIFTADNIPTVSWLTFDKKCKMPDMLKRVENFGYPVVVKPNALGSSIGVKLVENAAEFVKAVNVAFEFDSSVIVERAVSDVREFNCAVLRGNDGEVVSTVDEPKTGDQIFSFADKYLTRGVAKNKTKQKVAEALISENLEYKIKSLTKKAVNSLGLFGVVRVDFLYDARKKKLYVNEVNAVPGSLAYFLFPGFTQTKLIDELVRIAEEMKETRVKIKREYITEVLK